MPGNSATTGAVKCEDGSLSTTITSCGCRERNRSDERQFRRASGRFLVQMITETDGVVTSKSRISPKSARRENDSKGCAISRTCAKPGPGSAFGERKNGGAG